MVGPESLRPIGSAKLKNPENPARLVHEGCIRKLAAEAAPAKLNLSNPAVHQLRSRAPDLDVKGSHVEVVRELQGPWMWAPYPSKLPGSGSRCATERDQTMRASPATPKPVGQLPERRRRIAWLPSKDRLWQIDLGVRKPRFDDDQSSPHQLLHSLPGALKGTTPFPPPTTRDLCEGKDRHLEGQGPKHFSITFGKQHGCQRLYPTKHPMRTTNLATLAAQLFGSQRVM